MAGPLRGIGIRVSGISAHGILGVSGISASFQSDPGGCGVRQLAYRRPPPKPPSGASPAVTVAIRSAEPRVPEAARPPVPVPDFVPPE